MINEPSKLVAARAALEKAEEDLGDPGRLGRLRNVIKFLMRGMSADSPQIQRDIARKLVLTYRSKVASEVKDILANVDAYEPEFLEYWNEVMEVFEDASLADDPEFDACKQQLRARRGRESIDSLKAADVDIPKKEQQVAGRKDDLYSKILTEVRAMLHAKSLRAIGQSLAMIRLQAFSLEKKGDFYIIRSESLTETHEWILRNDLAEKNGHSALPDQRSTQLTVGDGWFCYGPLDIARLSAREAKKADHHDFKQTREADKLAQLLRILGEHLDSKSATAFKISWAPDLVSVEYQTPNSVRERKDFSVEKLHQLALCSRFRRSSSSASIGSR